MATIVTNNKPRDILYYHELTEVHQREVDKDMDWLDDKTIAELVVYRGQVYALDEFMAVHNRFYNPNPPAWMLPYDGYTNDTFFSGVLFRYAKDDCGDLDTERVVMATFY